MWNYIKCDVSTICIGLAASAASLLLCCGAKGKRFALPNSEIMIHQPWLPQTGGQVTDLEITVSHVASSASCGLITYEPSIKSYP